MIFLKSIRGHGTCQETAFPANGGEGRALQEDNSEHLSEIPALNCPQVRSSWFVNHSGNPERQVSLRWVMCFRSLMTSPAWLPVHVRKLNLLGGNRQILDEFPAAAETVCARSTQTCPWGLVALHQQCWCSEVASDRFLPCICRNAEFSKECRKKNLCVSLFIPSIDLWIMSGKLRCFREF